MKSATCKGSNGQYLEEYHSESAAKIAAEDRDGKFIPMQCSRCGYWHLTIENTRRLCHHCTDSALFQKDLYATREEAQRTADYLRREKRIQLFPYKCPHSGGWHLTKKK